jgi:two-component system chemotaxis response regulator CheY/two-component system phosphate regulon response regulator PhoB
MRPLTPATFPDRHDQNVSVRSERTRIWSVARKPVLLVIEDDEDTRDMLRVLFESGGFTVVEGGSDNGGDVVAEIAAVRPDLIVLDGRLDGREDGWSICRRLRSCGEPIHAVPVIFASAAVFPDCQARAFEAGCNLFFTKPFDIYQLLSAAQELVMMFQRVH